MNAPLLDGVECHIRRQQRRRLVEHVEDSHCQDDERGRRDARPPSDGEGCQERYQRRADEDRRQKAADLGGDRDAAGKKAKSHYPSREVNATAPPDDRRRRQDEGGARHDHRRPDQVDLDEGVAQGGAHEEHDDSTERQTDDHPRLAFAGRIGVQPGGHEDVDRPDEGGKRRGVADLVGRFRFQARRDSTGFRASAR